MRFYEILRYAILERSLIFAACSTLSSTADVQKVKHNLCDKYDVIIKYQHSKNTGQNETLLNTFWVHS